MASAIGHLSQPHDFFSQLNKVSASSKRNVRDHNRRERGGQGIVESGTARKTDHRGRAARSSPVDVQPPDHDNPLATAARYSSTPCAAI